jgi:hypothetical protein
MDRRGLSQILACAPALAGIVLLMLCSNTPRVSAQGASDPGTSRSMSLCPGVRAPEYVDDQGNLTRGFPAELLGKFRAEKGSEALVALSSDGGLEAAVSLLGPNPSQSDSYCITQFELSRGPHSTQLLIHIRPQAILASLGDYAPPARAVYLRLDYSRARQNYVLRQSYVTASGTPRGYRFFAWSTVDSMTGNAAVRNFVFEAVKD